MDRYQILLNKKLPDVTILEVDEELKKRMDVFALKVLKNCAEIANESIQKDE